MRNELAPHMVESLDLLARNAFLASPFYSFAGGATSFGTLEANDTFEVGITRAVKLGAEYEIDIQNNPIFCITSPAATYTIKSGTSSDEWISRMMYANPTQLINWEIGSYNDVRFATNPLMTLWNVGTVIAQTAIKVAIAVGDGAPDPATSADRVDGVWETGQAGATHLITVASTTGFAVGDIVTLHTARNGSETATTVLNGVQWNHAKNMNLRIVKIPSGATMCFDKPVLTCLLYTSPSPRD